MGTCCYPSVRRRIDHTLITMLMRRSAAGLSSTGTTADVTVKGGDFTAHDRSLVGADSRPTRADRPRARGHTALVNDVAALAQDKAVGSKSGVATSLTLMHRCADALAFLEAVGAHDGVAGPPARHHAHARRQNPPR